MCKRNKKKLQRQNVNYVYHNISKDCMIQIHTEAYYKALKKIEQEKTDSNESVTEKKKEKWHTRLFFVLNVLFCPWIISKRFKLNKGIYDSILIFLVSGALVIIGTFMWLFGIYLFAYGIWQMIKVGISNDLVAVSFIGMFLFFLGSVFVLASKEFSDEMDSNKIYAYSACIIALVSCVASIITLLKV